MRTVSGLKKVLADTIFEIDPKRLGFVIYLGLRMYQFQEYCLLKWLYHPQRYKLQNQLNITAILYTFSSFGSFGDERVCFAFLQRQDKLLGIFPCAYYLHSLIEQLFKVKFSSSKYVPFGELFLLIDDMHLGSYRYKSSHKCFLINFSFAMYNDRGSLHAISSYKDHCNFSNTSGPYFGANFEY